MALSDPQTITINAVANSLARIGFGENSGRFRKDDTTVELAISHQYGSRTRRVMRIDHRKIATDPLVPTVNVPYNMNFYIVLDVPKVGYTIAEQKQVIDGFITYLNASSGAKITQLLGGES